VGRAQRGVDELLARMAASLGDAQAARAYSDLARDRRQADGAAAALRARRALEAGRLDEAAGALGEAERLLPADASVLALRARLAMRSHDASAFAAAVARLREFSPSLESAILAENRLRLEGGLPLLPALSAEALLAEPPNRVVGDGAPRAAAR
jgi:Tfp pilus assembly protein PilF